MELTGRIKFISALDKGQDKNGKDFEKAFFILSDEVGQYPNRYKVDLYNKTDLMRGVKHGDRIKVQVNANAKEYNGKWYGSLNAYKLEIEVPATTQSEPMSTQVAPITTKEGESLQF